MDMKQRNIEYKSITERKPIKRLVHFVSNLEEKLVNLKIINDKLHDLMSIVSKTHETIIEEITTIKAVLNQKAIEQDDDEIISIDATKSEWDDDEDDNQTAILRKTNVNFYRTDSSILNSASTVDSSSTKRSSAMKSNDPLPLNGKLPKSVSFTAPENSLNENLNKNTLAMEEIIPPNKEIKKERFEEITTPFILLPHLKSSKQNHVLETTPNPIKTQTTIRIHEIEPHNGDYIRLVNVSNSDDYDLTGHFLQQSVGSKVICRFRFPENTIINARHTITIWCGHLKDVEPQPPHVFLWKEQNQWETKAECLTILARSDGQTIATYRSSPWMNTNQSSSDILFVHSKSNTTSSDICSTLSNSSTSKSRRPQPFYVMGTTKPPFAHSPNSAIHPDYHGTHVKIPDDLRSQMHQRNGTPQLRFRAKSSPYANHAGCKQDLLSLTVLRTYNNIK